MDFMTDVEIECPYCGGVSMERVDSSIEGSQEMIVDCTVCCRPIEFSVECERGEVVAVQVER